MGDLLYPLVVLLTWVSLGTFAFVVFLARHGRRDLRWFMIAALLGPIFLPIAAEMDRRGQSIEHWSTPRDTTTRAGSWSALVAVDGSEESHEVVDDLARLAQGSGAQVHLIHVLDPDDAEEEDVAAAHRMLDECADRLAGVGGRLVREVAAGDTARVILEYAEAHGVDVLVIGRKGRGLSKHLVGSIAEHLVKRAPQAVLVGESMHARESARSPSPRHRTAP